MSDRKPPHVFDLVAEDVARYIERASDELAAAVQEQGVAPFSQPLNRAEQERYYVTKYGHFVFNEDGTPNEQGREQLLQAFGPDAFAEIVRVVLRERRNEPPFGSAYSYPVFAPERAPAPVTAQQLPPPAAPPPGTPSPLAGA